MFTACSLPSFFVQNQKRCWSVRFNEWLDKKKKSKNISKSPENYAAWKVEDIDEFGQKPTDPDAQPKLQLEQQKPCRGEQKFTETLA